MTQIYGFGRPPTPPPEAPVVPLEAPDVARLNLGWSSSYTPRELEEHVLAHPGLCWWSPALGEYLIGGPWRHRAEIAVIQELSARFYPEKLAEAFTAACRERGYALAVMLDQHETRRQGFYERIGFELLQEIIIYELPRLPRPIPEPATLRFERYAPAALDELVAVDHAAFPWIWRNSPEEFAAYMGLYGVEVYLGREPDGAAVTYFGITSYRGWGHLDRIAVLPDRQGRGYGLETLNAAVARLGEHGARRIGLSTQIDNPESQRLYERYGFRRTTGNDYTIYGAWLDEGVRREAAGARGGAGGG
jgi:ribosomal protein S18 acetylase RimI-like enzyme